MKLRNKELENQLEQAKMKLQQQHKKVRTVVSSGDHFSPKIFLVSIKLVFSLVKPRRSF